ncbi:hypothetical protein EDD18DRAFT_1351915 [Armillaria luteobubalina]|uniref:Peptidase C14 caspase domain-containing protein n=1 Tax=Armillaria luteobubalina TaxID=153913 RepID=A0AA39TQZ4_9AGAR|nr:hypothetical protein EDD18DRAFT_1351915 [Armillaria luteobubalina]
MVIIRVLLDEQYIYPRFELVMGVPVNRRLAFTRKFVHRDKNHLFSTFTTVSIRVFKMNYCTLRRLRGKYASGDEIEAMKLKALPTSIGTLHYIDASRFWAVIIGIDAYRRFPLYGCVADALLMKEYLERDLRVPSNHIQLLLGTRSTSYTDPSYPSRENITNTPCSLINNPYINKGDNIVIYFAGHGSSYGCSQCPGTVKGKQSIVPDVRASTSRMYGTRIQGHRHVDTLCPTEVICPIDRSPVDANRFGTITDISDRELNTHLHEILRAKGNKITAIFDCCHSSGVTRGERSAVRSALPLNETRDLMLSRWEVQLEAHFQPYIDNGEVVASRYVFLCHFGGM